MDDDDVVIELTAATMEVLEGYRKAMVKAHAGDPKGALADLDAARDLGLRQEQDTIQRIHIECVRLEMHIAIASVSRDWALLANTLIKIGESRLFPTKKALEGKFMLAGSAIHYMMKEPRE